MAALSVNIAAENSMAPGWRKENRQTSYRRGRKYGESVLVVAQVVFRWMAYMADMAETGLESLCG